MPLYSTVYLCYEKKIRLRYHLLSTCVHTHCQVQGDLNLLGASRYHCNIMNNQEECFTLELNSFFTEEQRTNLNQIKISYS